MSSGLIPCPECHHDVTTDGWRGGRWTEIPQPWKCTRCGAKLRADASEPDGLKVVGRAFKEVYIRIDVVGVKWFSVKYWIGKQIVKLGFWIMGPKVVFHKTDPE